MNDYTKTNKVISFILVIVILLLSVTLYAHYREFNPSENTLKDLHLISSFESNPKPLQDLFLQRIKSGQNDKLAKMSAYWIAHRYFDNGGDMQEIFGFVSSHPELAFLKEAETIYPEIFERFKDGQVKKNSYDSLYLFLANLEILDKNGYADLATLSTLMSSYSQLAHYNREMSLVATSTEQKEKYGALFVNTLAKSQLYFNKSYPMVDSIMLNNKETLEDTDIRDVIVGLNKYVLVTAYYDNLGVKYTSTSKRSDVFEYASRLAKEHTPNLYSTSAHDYAISLALSGEINTKSDAYMWSLLKLIAQKDNRNGSLVLRVTRKEGVFGRDVTATLAEHCLEFKKWLIENSDGNWKEEDFSKIKTSLK